jgi:hypothetical protein
VAADHDKVGLPLLRSLDDFRSRRSQGNERERVGVRLQAGAEIRDQSRRVLPGGENELVRGDARIRPEDQRWIDDIDQGDLGMK